MRRNRGKSISRLATRLSPFLSHAHGLKVMRAVKGYHVYLAHFLERSGIYHLLRFDCALPFPTTTTPHFSADYSQDQLQAFLEKHGFMFSWVPWKPCP